MLRKYQSEVKFAKKVGVYLAGGAVGVLAEKLVNDIIAKGALPNPAFATVQLSDVAMVVTELGVAYYLKKKPSKRKKLASNFLVGMATGTVSAQAYEWGAQQGSWVGLQRSGSLAMNGRGTTPFLGTRGLGKYR